MKCLFFGTPDFAVSALESLIKHHEVLAVVTQPDRPSGRGQKIQFSPVKVLALAHKIEVLQPEKARDPLFLSDIEKRFGQNGTNPVDIAVVVAYGQILKKSLLDLPKFGSLNIHGSLLPRWRGAAPIHYALWKGDSVTGICTMQMTEALDAGDVYLSTEVSITPRDDYQSLYHRLKEKSGPLLLQTLDALSSGNIKTIPQDPTLVTFAPKIEKSVQTLKPEEQSAREVSLIVRAFHSWPGAKLVLEQNSEKAVLKIHRVAMLRESITDHPGRMSVDHGRLFLHCKTGVLEILELQSEGGKTLQAHDWLQGTGRKFHFPIQSKELRE